MEPTLLDTDMLSEVFRGRNRAVLTRAQQHRDLIGPYAVSVISVAEVVRGIQRMERHGRINAIFELLRNVDVISLDAEAAIIGGRIAGDLDRMGLTIGLADPLIAGVAIRRNVVLATGNTAHYQRIIDLGYDLKLDNWRDNAGS